MLWQGFRRTHQDSACDGKICAFEEFLYGPPRGKYPAWWSAILKCFFRFCHITSSLVPGNQSKSNAFMKEKACCQSFIIQSWVWIPQKIWVCVPRPSAFQEPIHFVIVLWLQVFGPWCKSLPFPIYPGHRDVVAFWSPLLQFSKP